MDQLTIQRKMKHFNRNLSPTWPSDHPLVTSIREAIAAGDSDRLRGLMDTYYRRHYELTNFRDHDFTGRFGGQIMQAETAIRDGNVEKFHRMSQLLGI